LLNIYFKHRINYYLTNSNSLKQILADGDNVIFGLRLNNSFYGNTSGIIKNNQPNQYNHCMLICGYNDKDQTYKVANSWGRRWGDKGYCHIPQEYVHKYGFDFIVIKEKK